jgi:hypothetical protein
MAFGGFELKKNWLVKRGFCREVVVEREEKSTGESVVFCGVERTGVVGPEKLSPGTSIFLNGV